MTISDLVLSFERRAAEAEREGATAPVANIYRLVLEELRPFVPNNGISRAAPAEPSERLLTAVQVAQLLSTTVRWVYAHAAELGARHLSRRCVRFPETGVRRRLRLTGKGGA